MSYSRTKEGETELVARTLPLSIPARRTLNAITTEMTLEAIQAVVRFGEVDRILKELIDRGLITGSAGSVSVLQPAAARENVAPAAAKVAPASNAPPLVQTDFAKARQLAARFITDHMGPDGESLALRFERAREPIALEQAAYDARRILFELRGRAIADKFSDNVLVPVFGSSVS
jgi:hypothetical protein